jgi:hypothetical protein
VASPFQGDINALAEAGITHGCGAGIFCPDATLSRGEAASFVVRASRLAAMRPAVEEGTVPVLRHRFRAV